MGCARLRNGAEAWHAACVAHERGGLSYRPCVDTTTTSGSDGPDSDREAMSSSPFARALQAANAWLDIRGVEAVGEGKTRDGEDCVVVIVSTSDAANEIPSLLEGFKVLVRRTK